MTNTIVVGTQWGDEGKAKIVDLMAETYDVITRYNGGANAGHTSEAEIDGGFIKFISHLVPAGALHPGKKCVIGNGVVLEPKQLLSEIEELESKRISIRDRLYISKNCHMVMPYHIILDGASDAAKGKQRLGTTNRGIGPCYSDKAARIGLRAEELLNKNKLLDKITKVLQEKNYLFARFGQKPITSELTEEIVNFYFEFGKRFEKNMVDVSYFLDKEMKQGKKILFEGAQATFLDIDHGTYPYVTSSNCIAGGACTGTGVGPTKIDKTVGVVKAYVTRVGEGGFPTELGEYEETKLEQRATVDVLGGLEIKVNSGNATEQEIGKYIRGVGLEYGATTGRPRRTGWFDGVMLKKAAIVNGLSEIAVTKLDVLDRLDKIKVCVAYEIDGIRTEEFPTDVAKLSYVKPVYEVLDGWKQDTSRITDYNKLPENAKTYLEKIAELAGAEIGIVSVGSKRNQTIMM